MTVNHTSCVANTAKAFGMIADDSDTLKKASSVTISVIDIALDIFSFFPAFVAIKTGLGLLRGRLNDMKTIINATSVLGRFYEWADDNECKKIMTKSWQKAASRITLTVAQVFDTVGIIDKFTYKFFSQPSLSIEGKIPVFDLVKNGLYLISSVFGLWDANLDMDEAQKRIKKAGILKKKWELKQVEFKPDLLKFNRLAYLDKYKKKINLEQSKGVNSDVAKLGKYNQYIRSLTVDSEEPEAHKSAVASFQVLRAIRLKSKFETELQSVQTKKDKVKTQELKTYIKAIEKGFVKEVVDYQVASQKVTIHNSKNSHKKAWISVAAEACKIFMITMGTLVLCLSLVFPVLSTPAANIVMNSFGLVSNSFGLAKNLYRDVVYESKVQKLKAFEIPEPRSTL